MFPLLYFQGKVVQKKKKLACCIPYLDCMLILKKDSMKNFVSGNNLFKRKILQVLFTAQGLTELLS